MAKRRYVALNTAARCRINHRRRTHRLRVPSKQAGEKTRRLGAVAAPDFKMHNWLTQSVPFGANHSTSFSIGTLTRRLELKRLLAYKRRLDFPRPRAAPTATNSY